MQVPYNGGVLLTRSYFVLTRGRKALSDPRLQFGFFHQIRGSAYAETALPALITVPS